MTQPAHNTALREPGPICRPAGVLERSRALALLLTGSENGDGEAVAQFLASAREQQINLDHLWIASGSDQSLTASLLLVPSAGKTAMVFLSPVTEESVDDAAHLAQACVKAQDPSKLRLVQSLLDSWQNHEATAFAKAGFGRLANLLYLQRSLDPAPSGEEVRLETNGEFDVLRWGLTTRGRFEKAILASYENTRDCPGLVGLRSIDDVLASHRASGVFTPELWHCFWKDGEPVGVMLINLMTQRSSAELVYLGLSEKWRGKGLGKRLMLYAIALTSQRGCSTMMTAVDEENPPAVALYESLGFAPHARKLAMIHALT